MGFSRRPADPPDEGPRPRLGAEGSGLGVGRHAGARDRLARRGRQVGADAAGDAPDALAAERHSRSIGVAGESLRRVAWSGALEAFQIVYAANLDAGDRSARIRSVPIRAGCGVMPRGRQSSRSSRLPSTRSTSRSSAWSPRPPSPRRPATGCGGRRRHRRRPPYLPPRGSRRPAARDAVGARACRPARQPLQVTISSPRTSSSVSQRPSPSRPSCRAARACARSLSPPTAWSGARTIARSSRPWR